MRILIAEDDDIIALHLERSLKKLGYEVVAQTDRGEDCLRLVEEQHPDLILMDIRLRGDLDGIKAAAEIHARFSLPVVYLTSYSDESTLQRVKNSGVSGYIVKPFTPEILRSTIELAYYNHCAAAEIRSLSRFSDESPHPILRISHSGRILYANAASAPLFAEHGCGRGAVIPPEWAEYVSKAMHGQKVQTELVCGEHYYSCTWTPIPGSDYINLYAYDITDRRRLEIGMSETQEQLNLALQSARMGIWNWDLVSDQVRVDETVMEIYQGRRMPLDTTILQINEYVHPADRQMSLEAFYKAARNPGSQFDIEYRVIWPDGSVHTIAARGHIYRDETCRALRMIGVTWDVSERRAIEEEVRRLNTELEERVSQRTAQLQNTLSELESFSYSVSHDLRSPLRAVNGFGRILEEDYGAKLDAAGLQHIHRIREASANMARLIDDLLNLSRVARAEIRLAPIDLSAMVNRIAAELSQSEPERQVTWIIPNGIVANGDENLLQSALGNLLANAWKFTSRTPRARIEFGLEIQVGRRVFYLRDNGAGFEMEYASKLFGAFQRLHAPSEFEGTGIGLATVQRIIRRHGGDIWAIGEVDKGATFFFTLP